MATIRLGSAGAANAIRIFKRRGKRKSRRNLGGFSVKLYTMSNKKSKNVSKTVHSGTILRTRDEYFEGSKNYRKPGYEKAGHYRATAVVESNRHDELAVVKLTTSAKAKKIAGKSGFRAYIETTDDNGKAIRISGKFIPDKRGKTLTKKQINEIKKDCITDPKTGRKNRGRLKKLKGRK